MILYSVFLTMYICIMTMHSIQHHYTPQGHRGPIKRFIDHPSKLQTKKVSQQLQKQKQKHPKFSLRQSIKHFDYYLRFSLLYPNHGSKTETPSGSDPYPPVLRFHPLKSMAFPLWPRTHSVRNAPTVWAPSWSFTWLSHQLHVLLLWWPIHRRFSQALLYSIRLHGLLRHDHHGQAQLWLYHRPQGHSGPEVLLVVRCRWDPCRFASLW